MKEERLKNTLAEIARSSIPDDLNLWPHIAARLEKRNSLMQTLRTKPILIVLLLILALIFLSGVAYAINHLLGYLPGIGIVDQSAPLRVLAEPVEVTRDGVTVRIEQVVADPQRTIILYKTEGLSIKAANSKGEIAPFGSPHLLVLSDGSILEEATPSAENGVAEPIIQALHTQGGWPNYVWRLVYPAIPANVNELTLLIPILHTMPAGAAPENWQITFHLKPAPADLTVMPFIQVDSANAVTSTVIDNRSVGEATQNLSSTAEKKGFTFKLDNVIELQDGFVLSGSLTWQNTAFSTLSGSVKSYSKPRLSDRNGNDIPLEEVPVDYYGDETSRNWSYRTNQKYFAAPLTLTFDSIEMDLYPNPINFELDLGDHPQVGKRWEVNREFSIEGHTLRLLYVELIQLNGDTCWQYSLEFHFKSDNAIVTAGVEDVIPQTPLKNICGGGGGGGPVSDATIFLTGVPYPDIPQGRHVFKIIPAFDTVVTGPWELAWQPPISTETTPTPNSQICLTEATLEQLKNQDKTKPSAMQGKFAFTTLDNQIQIVSWDGKVTHTILNGNWPALAHDGKLLAYSGVEGNIHIMDLIKGETITTNGSGYNPIWSTDDQRILFTDSFGISLINRDGSALAKIEIGSNQILSLVGWLDSNTIVYGVLGGEGFTFTKQNLQSGEKMSLFTIQQKAGYGAISPDGKRMVFADKVFGADNRGIFIAKIDGSERRMIVSPDVSTAYKTLWSPDGNWLLVNIKKNGQDFAMMVNPFTCQLYPLENINQLIESWSK